MIKVYIEKDDKINSIKISGHAGYNESGKDIVCASVSSIAITTVNAIVRLDRNSISFDERDGFLKLDILSHSDIVDTLIENMIELFYELEEQYPKYIKLEK